MERTFIIMISISILLLLDFYIHIRNEHFILAAADSRHSS